ncbi:phage antirepressor N-terminal domain-containing protein [Xenorhabdus innexi]|uniref:phage antirepressor N-terminal domain-containing protein n=1 Tax=Xenorhabdus innexi TaxID=290109 RepID=UPI001FCEC968|nr:phage antirepressor N-terminal domain-containing protein [Xenorhabdus innexi]
MSIIPANQSNTINVPFHGAVLYVINHNGEPYVPMKPIVNGIAMNWAGQHKKLKQRFKSGIDQIPMISADGKVRNMTCLALCKLADWLTTIAPDKVKPEIKEQVTLYQAECHDVLHEHWITGVVKKKGYVKPPDFRYTVKLEIYDNHSKRADTFTHKMATPEGIIQGVAKLYGYYIDKMMLMPESAL